MELKNYLNDKKATVYGLERFTGAISGKTGSFVLEHSGKFENGAVTSTRKIVVGSGTNELAGIQGEAQFNSGESKEFHLTLTYYFPD